MPTPGQELSTLDFSSLIGGPLCAVVEAQRQSSLTTLNFIKTVGFGPDTTDEDGNVVPGKPIIVSFRYGKEASPYQPESVTIGIDALVGGSGYAAAPGVKITGGTGSGATAVAVLGNTTADKSTVTAINITSQGTGYNSTDNLVVQIDP